MNNWHEETDPRGVFADFLRTQAAEAGMGADKIAKAFVAAARQQHEHLEAQREAGQEVEPPAHPISKMAASKSHIDRLFKGQAHPKPPLPFTLQFLRITNRAAGLSAEEHRSRCERARSLLQAIMDTPEPPPPARLPATGNDTVEHREDAVAVLRLEVDLERARHAETRLRYALRDHDVLLSTLLQIISTLREIIAGNDIRELQVRQAPAELARVRDETRQALDHKATAQQEADRAAARMSILEDLWNRARAEAQRLASHPDAAGLALSHLDPQLAPQPFLASELLTRPALDDIGAALAKAHEVNLREEKAVQELRSAITPQAGPLEPDEELTVLITATRLTDPAARRTALTTLVSSWAHDSVAREAVLRLADDPNEGVRIAAIEALAEGWPGDPDIREAVLRYIDDLDEKVQWAAVKAMAEGWPGDHVGWKAVLRLTWDRDKNARRVAVEALAKGWRDEPAALERVLALTRSRDANVQEVAFAALARGWPGNPAARNAVLSRATSRDWPTRRAAIHALAEGWADGVALRTVTRLSKDQHTDTRRVAVEALAKGWPGDPVVLRTLLHLTKHPDWTTRRTAVYALADGWPKDSDARRAVIGLTADMDENVREAASEVLGSIF
ncbi:HEAT repeat domain-containing protein [Streptomyces sp. NPDC013178]|uniref:HEAT repeat domain-containing protein n=1 Tax=Streptomyces sp. NPDC013178 TaxID=3155118 RepID=UPI0033E40A9C